MDPIAVVEVIFGHEYFQEMVLEQSNYLGEFSSLRYSMGFQFIRSSIEFQVLFFILKKRMPVSRENINSLKNFYEVNGNKKFNQSKCVKIQWTDIELSQSFLDRLDCELILIKEFNERNYTDKHKNILICKRTLNKGLL